MMDDRMTAQSSKRDGMSGKTEWQYDSSTRCRQAADPTRPGGGRAGGGQESRARRVALGPQQGNDGYSPRDTSTRIGVLT